MVESASLLRMWAGNRLEGSNPSLSANKDENAKHLRILFCVRVRDSNRANIFFCNEVEEKFERVEVKGVRYL